MQVIQAIRALVAMVATTEMIAMTASIESIMIFLTARLNRYVWLSEVHKRGKAVASL
jgi:hypothetical protein